MGLVMPLIVFQSFCELGAQESRCSSHFSLFEFLMMVSISMLRVLMLGLARSVSRSRSLSSIFETASVGMPGVIL